MSYASKNYSSSNQGYGDDNDNETGNRLDLLRDKYGSNQSPRTALQQSPSQGSTNDQTSQERSDYRQGPRTRQSDNQRVQDWAAVDAQARDAAAGRQEKINASALNLSGQRDDQIAKSEAGSRRLIQSIDQGKVDVDNKFKASESSLDRNKSSDEFTQNRYQTKANQAQDRANLEYSTAQGLVKDKQGQDAELARLRAAGDVASALADKTNNVNLNLANITATTERSGQASAVDRARLAANAQVKTALYSPRSYQGY
jgi:hypothetical protein